LRGVYDKIKLLIILIDQKINNRKNT